LGQRNQVQVVSVKLAVFDRFNVIFHAINMGYLCAFVKYIIPSVSGIIYLTDATKHAIFDA
jgi:hypothetical protein